LEVKVAGKEIEDNGSECIEQQNIPKSLTSRTVAFEVEFLQDHSEEYPYKDGAIPEPSTRRRHDVLAQEEDHGYQKEVEEDG